MQEGRWSYEKKQGHSRTELDVNSVVVSLLVFFFAFSVFLKFDEITEQVIKKSMKLLLIVAIRVNREA